MGFRGGLKSGGGFWNNVDGKLTNFVFTDVPPGDDAEAGEWLYLVPSFQADGSEDETTQHLFFGAVERYSVSKDGKTVTSLNEDGSDAEVTTIGAKTPAGRFLDSLVTQGEEKGIEAILPDLEGGDPLNLDALEGTRVRLVQEKDEAGTKKRGQRTDPKTGKKYDRTVTVVAAVYDLPGAKTGGKAGTKGAKGKGGDEAIRDKADKVVTDLIAASTDKKNKTGETPVSKFKIAALKAYAKDADKDAVIKLLGTEEYRLDAAERGVFAYDAEGETVQTAE